MKTTMLSRYTFSISAAVGCFGGCGGPFPPPTSTVGWSSAAERPGAGLLDLAAARSGGAPSTEQKYKAASPLIFVVNYITSSGVGDVVIYDPKKNDPTPIAMITNGIDLPNGDCIDSNGTLYVGNDPGGGAGWISEYAAGELKPFNIITDGVDGPALCTIDGQGNLWVTNSGGTPNATEYLKGSVKPHTRITKGLTYPVGIAIDHHGTLYVANHVLYGTTNVQVYPPHAKSPTRTVTDGVVWPVGIATDTEGTLYVANGNTPCNIEEYRSGESHPYKAITDGIAGATGLSFGKNGWGIQPINATPHLV